MAVVSVRDVAERAGVSVGSENLRIDRGNLNSSYPIQQVDHVVVQFNGQIIGRDGKPISGSIRDNYEMAHIPLSEWLTRSTTYSP